MINPPAEATEVLDCSSLPAAAATAAATTTAAAAAAVAVRFFLRDVKRYPLSNIYALGYPNLNKQNPSDILTNLESLFVHFRISSYLPSK